MDICEGARVDKKVDKTRRLGECVLAIYRITAGTVAHLQVDRCEGDEQCILRGHDEYLSTQAFLLRFSLESKRAGQWSGVFVQFTKSQKISSP